MPRSQLNVRVPDTTTAQLEWLTANGGYESQAHAVIIAVDRLYTQETSKMAASIYDYTVLEDNGGGLHLFLFHPGSDTPVDGFTGFEYTPGSLIESLDTLDAGDDASTWDGRMDDVAGMWQAYLDNEFGYAVICYGENGQRTVKPDKMGRAGQIEFGIESA